MEDNGGELAGCLETRCRQLRGLLRERGEVVCPLEATHDQAGQVLPSGVEGASAADRCTPSLGGMEAPEPIVVARIPSVVTCVVSKCVYTSVAKCVLQRAHSVGARACVRATPRVRETVCVSERVRMKEAVCVSERVCVNEARCVRGTACVRSLCVREMTVGMWEHAAASPSVSVVTRRCAWIEWR